MCQPFGCHHLKTSHLKEYYTYIQHKSLLSMVAVAGKCIVVFEYLQSEKYFPLPATLLLATCLPPLALRGF
jgi:hypothetical protein